MADEEQGEELLPIPNTDTDSASLLGQSPQSTGVPLPQPTTLPASKEKLYCRVLGWVISLHDVFSCDIISWQWTTAPRWKCLRFLFRRTMGLQRPPSLGQSVVGNLCGPCRFVYI